MYRNYISKVAMEYSIHDREITRIKYTDTETSVWGHCYKKLKEVYEHGA